MRRVAVLIFCLASCGRSETKISPQSFIAWTYLAASGDIDVCALARRQARLPETRALGTAVHRTLIGVRDDLAAIAQRRHLPLAKSIEEKKQALRDNLSILSGRVFDQGYALAMVQDTRALLQAFDAAGALDDEDVHKIVTKYRPQLEAEQRDSSHLLAQLGGPPWPAFKP
jgi:predicted outer membrane protein